MFRQPRCYQVRNPIHIDRSTTQRHLQPKWISIFQRIAVNVSIEIDPTTEPNRILTDKPLQAGMIVAGAVVQEATAVVFTTRVLEAIPARRAGCARHAERLVGVLRHETPRAIA